MNVQNEEILHKEFGVGTIVKQTATTVTVQFGDQHGVKNFLYPSAFESYLELRNPGLKEQMSDELRLYQVRIEKERQKHLDECKRRMEERRAAMLEKKRTSKGKSSTRKSSAKKPTKKKASGKPEKQADNQ